MCRRGEALGLEAHVAIKLIPCAENPKSLQGGVEGLGSKDLPAKLNQPPLSDLSFGADDDGYRTSASQPVLAASEKIQNLSQEHRTRNLN